MDELELREVADGVWTIGGGREWRPGQGFDALSERPATVRLPSLEAWAAFELGRSMGAAEPRVVVPGWQEAVRPEGGA
jgi:hypothetical protein